MDPARAAQVTAEIQAKIELRGYASVFAGPRPELALPTLAYTIGVSNSRHHRCEYTLNGLGFDAIQDALDALARRTLSGELIPKDKLLVEGVFQRGYLLRLRRVHPGHLARFPWIAHVLELPGPAAVWQAQFPAPNRYWPGDPGYNLPAGEQVDMSKPTAGTGS